MKIRVQANIDNPDYNIEVGRNILDSLLRKAEKEYEKVVLVTDKNIDRLFDLPRSVVRIVLEPGEKLKSFKNLESLCNQFSELGLMRNSLVLAVGGGVIGDLVGFAASIYLRGIDYWQVPTSLVAMVDSSIGGKTGINTKFGKNLVGAFFHPKKIVCDLAFLEKLPESEVKNGLAESVKHALIANLDLVEELRKNPISEKSVSESAKVKVDIIAKDPFEKNVRKWLNVGHTIGHAIEKMSKLKMPHGVAVAKGIYLESLIGFKLGKIHLENFRLIVDLLDSLGLDYKPSSKQNLNEMWDIMLQDKKNTKSDSVNLAVIVEPGELVEILPINKDQFLICLND